MSKSKKRRYDFDEFEDSEHVYTQENHVKKRRIERALRIKDWEALADLEDMND